MPEDRDHARSQAGHYGMGIRTAVFFPVGEILAVSAPLTDDPVVPIVVVMGISGALMLVLGTMRVLEWIRKKKAEKEHTTHK